MAEKKYSSKWAAEIIKFDDAKQKWVCNFEWVENGRRRVCPAQFSSKTSGSTRVTHLLETHKLSLPKQFLPLSNAPGSQKISSFFTPMDATNQIEKLVLAYCMD